MEILIFGLVILMVIVYLSKWAIIFLKHIFGKDN